MKLAIGINNIPRRYKATFPLKRIGFMYPHHKQEKRTYSNKLELCLRISSESEYAEDILNGETFHTPFPHVILKTPDMIHTYEVEKTRDAVYIMYDSSLENKLKEAGFIPDSPHCWQIELTSEINVLLSKMLEFTTRIMESSVIDKLDLVAMQLFEALLDQNNPQNRMAGDIEKKIQQVATYLQLNFNENIDMDLLVKKSGLSRRSFFRHWKVHNALTPIQYIGELRLRHAKILLSDTTASIEEIAEELKFCDSNYFCRAFKKRFSITPLQYRKKGL